MEIAPQVVLQDKLFARMGVVVLQIRAPTLIVKVTQLVALQVKLQITVSVLALINLVLRGIAALPEIVLQAEVAVIQGKLIMQTEVASVVVSINVMITRAAI